MGYIALFVGLFIEALFIYDLYCEKRELEANLKMTDRSIDFLTSQVGDLIVGKPMPVQQNRIKEAPGRPILSGAAARKAAEAMNAPYWSAEKKVPNSEIAKENANG
jgi:hypothetical protein